MTTDVLLAVFGVIGTAWAAWLTYRGTMFKARQDVSAINFDSMQKEIDRLRADLVLRDEQSRATHEEVLALRKGLQEAVLEIHQLQLSVAKYEEGSRILYFQLVENDIVPKFMPAGVSGEGV